MYFPNSQYRDHFYNLILAMTANQASAFTDLDTALSAEQIRVRGVKVNSILSKLLNF